MSMDLKAYRSMAAKAGKSAHRDRVNAKVRKDPRIANMCDEKSMPFDAKRMLYGGFKTIVEF